MKGHVQEKYDEPESANEGACLRYMMSRALLHSPKWAPSESASEAPSQTWLEEYTPSAPVGGRAIVKRLIVEAQTIVYSALREHVTSSLDASGFRFAVGSVSAPKLILCIDSRSSSS